jgi:DNA polymerase-4
MSGVLLYAEVPGFYAEVERAQRPELAGRPVIVGGDPRKKGLVQSATADARAAGVVAGMPVEEALALCRGERPRALRTEMARYREMDKRVRACIGHVCETLEPAGLGAAYLDVRAMHATPEVIARQLRDRVAAELHLPLHVGAAPTRALARIACERAGDGGFLGIAAADVERFLAPLPVTCLPGVGPNTAARLAELGAATVGALVALGRAAIERELGNHGLAILASALGQGDDRVRAARHPQTLSQEATLPAGEIDRVVLAEQLRGLAERLERALTLEGLVTRRVVLKLRYADGERVTRTQSLDRGLAAAGELLALAQDLLARTHAGSRPIRLLGLTASGLERPRRDERQLSLFER